MKTVALAAVFVFETHIFCLFWVIELKVRRYASVYRDH